MVEFKERWRRLPKEEIDALEREYLRIKDALDEMIEI